MFLHYSRVEKSILKIKRVKFIIITQDKHVIVSGYATYNFLVHLAVHIFHAFT